MTEYLVLNKKFFRAVCLFVYILLPYGLFEV